MRRTARCTPPVVLALTAALAILGASPAPARAQTTNASPAPRIELVGQDPWTPVGEDVTIRLQVDNPPPGATLSFTAHQAFTERSTYDKAMVGGPLGSVLGQVTRSLDAVPADASDTRTVTIGLRNPNGTRDPDRLAAPRAGVYPLEVELRNADDRTVSSFVTALVVSEATGTPSVTVPLDVVWVWPLVGAPSYLPSGEPDRRVVAELRPENRLGRQAVALRSATDVPLTLVPGPETLEAWTNLGRADSTVAAGADTVRSPPAVAEVLRSSYVPVDLPSLLDHGLTGAVDEQLARGNQALDNSVGSRTDRRTALVRPLSPGALTRLRTEGIDRAIVDGAALTPLNSKLTPAAPVILRAPTSFTTSDPVETLATDPGLQGFLTSDLPAALRAQLVLAGLSLVATEAPSVARVVTLVNPADFDAPSSLFSGLITGLRNNPYLRPVTAAQAFDTVPHDATAGVTGDRDFVATTSAVPRVSSASYQTQRNRINEFGTLTRPGDPAVAQADRSLLASVSSAWDPDTGRERATRHIDNIGALIARYLAQIQIPAPSTITLTSRSGAIPLTFRNETGYPVRLRAQLTSDKLFFPQGTVLDLDLPPKSSTVRVPVETRTSGTFPIELEVTSTNGVLRISHRRFEVRSTFVSTVGMALMGSAVLFLALWWGLDFRRRRRRRAETTA